MYATINGLNTYYEINGPENGMVVIFIHGFPFNSAMWKPQVDALKGKFRCITYDVRGHGKTEVGDGQYSVEYFVDDLLELMSRLAIAKATIVGLSMGGYIALRAAERNPDRIRALVLCDTRSEADGNESKIKRAMQAKTVKIEGSAAFGTGFVKAVFSTESINSALPAVNQIKSMIDGVSPVAISATLLALAARTDTTAALSSFTFPVLILVGESDAITPPSAAQAMRDKIPHAQLQIIPHAAHLSN
ncbi:MAG TPA: alpha/beta fold hydrolase, partial [Bacteroidota bacterium]|nr:alpha/beta fold hydrolase [Bacteroidota bacterium]